MLIDWFTVGAQALNFLILVWLMKRFLYKPILHAIDAREERIAKELADAAATLAEATRERGEFQKKNEAFDQERAALLGQAKDEANAERQRLLDEARQAADSLGTKRQESLATEARDLHQSITRLARDEVFSIARKTLADLASASLEEQIAQAFTRELRGLGGEAKQVLAAALKKGIEPALLRSAFDLSPDQQKTLQSAIHETFAAEISLRFETDPDAVCGIELSANGQKVAWSIAGYLTSLEKRITELVEPKDANQVKDAAFVTEGT